MSSASQQTIVTTFQQAAGSPPSSTDTSLTISGLTDALTQATQTINAETAATAANTDALAQNTQTKSSDGRSSVSDVVSTVSQFLGGGLSLLPLVSIFTSLFGGGDSQQAAPLTPYAMPSSLNLESTTNYQNVVYGENGLPKANDQAASSQTVSPQAAPSQTAASQAAPQITVQVQAMDSQSFLDHSNEIAQAVRQAMLNMNSLNDVVNDL